MPQLPDIAGKLSFRLEGTNGKAVLLIHGLTGAPAEMKLVGKRLNRMGYTVYAPLLAGHGTDEAALRATRWEDWAESVGVAAKQLAERTEHVYAAGICVGGKLAMMSAMEADSPLRGVAIYSPCFHYDGWNVPFYYPLLSYNIAWLSRIPYLDRISFGETPTMGIKDVRLRTLMQSMNAEGVLEDFPGKGLVEMRRLGKEIKRNLPKMRTPTLILHAREDDLSHPRNAKTIAGTIAATHALEWIEDSYHMIHVDKQHPKVAELTASFFEKHHDVGA